MPHIHEKVDFVADVYIVHGNTVLLRKHDKYKIWLAVGGHIELDEDPARAAVREVKEEVGLDVELAGMVAPTEKRKGYQELLPPRFMNRHAINVTHEHISFIYFATTEHTNIVQGETEISDDIHWFTGKELDDPAYGINDEIKFYAHAALEALS